MDASEIAQKLQSMDNEAISLSFISNRGLKVWPDGLPEAFCTSHWRCRFKAKDFAKGIDSNEIWQAIKATAGLDLDLIKTENLYTFDGKRGYGDAQAE